MTVLPAIDVYLTIDGYFSFHCTKIPILREYCRCNCIQTNFIHSAFALNVFRNLLSEITTARRPNFRTIYHIGNVVKRKIHEWHAVDIPLHCDSTTFNMRKTRK